MVYRMCVSVECCIEPLDDDAACFFFVRCNAADECLGMESCSAAEYEACSLQCSECVLISLSEYFVLFCIGKVDIPVEYFLQCFERVYSDRRGHGCVECDGCREFGSRGNTFTEDGFGFFVHVFIGTDVYFLHDDRWCLTTRLRTDRIADEYASHDSCRHFVFSSFVSLCVLYFLQGQQCFFFNCIDDSI